MFITKSDEAKTHPVLKSLAIAYPQDGLIAEDICPVVDVGEENEDGQFFVFDKSNLLGGIEDLRALGTRANSFDWKLSPSSFHCEEHSLEKPIDWREFKKWKKYLDLAKVTQDIAHEILLLNQEIRTALLYTTAANYATTGNTAALTGTSRFDDYVNSDPEATIETARDAVAVGAAEPNTIAIPVPVWRSMRRHPIIRSLMKENDSSQLTEDGFPTHLWGMKASFPGARYNAAMPGASESILRVWGKNIWLGVVNPNPNIRTMSFAYILRAAGLDVETYEDKPKKSDVVRVQHDIQDEKKVCEAAGYLLTTVIS